MTRIAPSDAVQHPGRSGLVAANPRGPATRPAPSSGFESTFRLLTAHAATPWAALAALGLVAAGATVWRGVQDRHAAMGIDPAALHLRSTTARPPEATEPVSVLIPVRHEPDPAVAAVRAALGQRGVDHLDIVVLDDGCPQETRAALRREFADDPRVRILATAPLPRGWSPLAHRSHQLAVAARGRVLIFAEPCAPLGPYAAAAATALLRGGKLDLAVLDTGRPAPVRTPTLAAPRQPSAAQAHNASSRTHPGRFTLAIDADVYWRIGGYRAAATDPDPLALLRTVRRASGRVAVADGRRVIPPALQLVPLPPPDPEAEALWDSQHASRVSLTATARRVLSALVGARAQPS
ncbi:hypothetical protein KGA66_27615 [Actinocrinis puniceicyclus]|uniref:Glycosyltransferase n=1 Tax=Actinocrinis puniceicyclus TaxID=977794 RepID=A0A8J8BHI1_9ACTN|nr:hypothetical protein [Actinocrinis puniceicyclus]MBS2966834.1 hypothetical protein [Actinocrinis puniceicyclus]